MTGGGGDSTRKQIGQGTFSSLHVSLANKEPLTKQKGGLQSPCLRGHRRVVLKQEEIA